jgi:hypothetical protein
MLKIISAALIATSMLAAPVMAATVIKTERAPVAKTVVVKPSVANAQARFVKRSHHHRHLGGLHKHRHVHAQKVIVIKKHRH